MRRFSGATFVIKYGGHAMGSAALAEGFARDIVLLKQVGINPVVVHGGGPQIKAMLDRLKIKSEFVEGLRVTDSATVEIVEMVLAGSINKQIVAAIHAVGGQAVGLSGKDAQLIEAAKLTRTQRDPQSSIEQVLDLGFVGEPVRIRTEVLEVFAGSEIVPVIAPIGLGADGHTYNINADTAAGAIAAALHARKLVLLTDVAGVLDRRGELISELSARRGARAARRRHGQGRHDPQARDLPRRARRRGRRGPYPRWPAAARAAARDLHRRRRRHQDRRRLSARPCGGLGARPACPPEVGGARNRDEIAAQALLLIAAARGAARAGRGRGPRRRARGDGPPGRARGADDQRRDRDRGARSAACWTAMREVPRDAFVPEPLRAYAYRPHPLPVGHEQNLAAPLLVALMTHLVAVEAGDVVFETGTDVGYQAALLSRPRRRGLQRRGGRAARRPGRAHAQGARLRATSSCRPATATSAGRRRGRSTSW